MEKQIFIIGKHHSTVDVITNSSSELFILEDILQTEQQLKDLCQQLIDVYNNFHKDDDKENLEFNKVFGHIGCVKAYKIADMIDGYSDSEYFMRSHKLDDEIMIIESAGDNSIPYEIVCYLEAMSWYYDDVYGSTKRIHLG